VSHNVDGECRIGFLLTPAFSILPFISAVEPKPSADPSAGLCPWQCRKTLQTDLAGLREHFKTFIGSMG
jgi:hypothetical protein